ncbi:MAG: hypothetical protein IJ551_09810 [Prevotella sp.]|nr:hypothetical protein [Prevotella sp.]
MTQDQVNSILTAICDEYEDKDLTRPNIEIMHGPANGYTVIEATFPAWELEADGILRCCTSNGTRWIAVESIHCIGI